MKISQFKSFKELISTPVNESEYNQKQELINRILNTSFANESWIAVILEFLNDNQTGKHYDEYYKTPDFSYGSRKCTYRFISTVEDMPHSIADSDVYVLKKFNAMTPFILYDYEEDPTADIFDYLTKLRTLKKVLESIGMSDELKAHLCEFCFYKVKQAEEQENLIDLGNGRKWDPELWKPIGFKPVKIDDYIKPGQSTGGFIPYQAPEDRYIVRGIMPMPEAKTLTLTPPKNYENK